MAFFIVALGSFGCGGSQARSDREKIVPEETQEESEELYGRQQMMGDYNATPAESHAASHEVRTRPVKNQKREEKSKKR